MGLWQNLHRESVAIHVVHWRCLRFRNHAVRQPPCLTVRRFIKRIGSFRHFFRIVKSQDAGFQAQRTNQVCLRQPFRDINHTWHGTAALDADLCHIQYAYAASHAQRWGDGKLCAAAKFPLKSVIGYASRQFSIHSQGFFEINGNHAYGILLFKRSAQVNRHLKSSAQRLLTACRQVIFQPAVSCRLNRRL